MSHWLEALILGGTTAFNGALIIMGKRLQNEQKRKLQDHTIPWCYNHHNTDWGFTCVKCQQTKSNRKQPPICDCVEYSKLHFHFKCIDCKYTAIMRTADDK